MQATIPASLSRILTCVIPVLFLAGCFGEGDGPTRIPGTPAPPPPDIPEGFCDPINFEDVCGPVNFIDFGGTASGAGGIATIINNPDASGINTSEKVAQMQKFAGEVFAGSAIELNEAINFAEGEAFTMKVWSSRSVPVLFKLEDAGSRDPNLGKESTVSHSGSGAWEQLCSDFSGKVTGFSSDTITLIFDLGVVGDAQNNPDDWTFFIDDITQVESCGGGGGEPVNLPVDFEGAPASYDFGAEAGFGGGVATVIANPDQSGLNATAQTARMQKFAGEVFGGATLSLSGDVDFSSGTAFRMKVWASRPVPVTFKFEDAVTGAPENGKEDVVSHSGSGAWEELCFDFTGDTAGFRTNKITFIFDNGVVGDAANNAPAWTFYFDEITQVATCADAPPPPGDAFPTITFDDPAVTYTLTDFGGNASEVVGDPVGGANQVARIIRGGDAQDWAGTTVSTLPNFAVPVIPFATGSTRMTVRTYSPDAGIQVRLKVESATDPTISVETEATTTVANGWETLTFDFANQAAGTAALNLANTYNKASIFFNFGVTGAVAGVKTYFFDDIAFGGGSGGGGDLSGLMLADFETQATGLGYTWAVFENDDNPPLAILANPDPTGANTSATVAQFTARQAGNPWAGTETARGDIGPLTLDASNSIVKVMVWKSVISPVGVKFSLPDGGARPEILVSNTLVNQWEELTFDFTGNIGLPESIGIVQLIIFPDFDLSGRTSDQIVFFDNVRLTDGT